MTEWSKVADCKSVGIIPRWFEPNSSHIKLFKIRIKKKNLKLQKQNYLYSYRQFKVLFEHNILLDNNFIDKLINSTETMSIIIVYNKIKKYNLLNINILRYNIYKFINASVVFRIVQHIISLNFKRRNFFPSIQSKKF